MLQSIQVKCRECEHCYNEESHDCYDEMQADMQYDNNCFKKVGRKEFP